MVIGEKLKAIAAPLRGILSTMNNEKRKRPTAPNLRDYSAALSMYDRESRVAEAILRSEYKAKKESERTDGPLGVFEERQDKC